MADFKKGDWVRMTEDDYNDGYKSGDAFRLVGVYERGVRFTDNDGDSRYADYDSGRFEPWTPKIGELVRFTEECSGNYWFFGPDTEVTHGVVAEDDRSSSYRFQVDTSKGCAFVNVRHIEPLPVAVEAQPAAPVAEPLTIRAGGFYKTRDGRKVGPIKASGRRFDYVWTDGKLTETGDYYSRDWCDDGTFHKSKPNHQLDIIAEWIEEPATKPTTNVAATVDALDDEYGPVVVAVADRDNDTVCFTVSLDTSELHEELDAVIAKLKKIRKLQRELGLIAA